MLHQEGATSIRQGLLLNREKQRRKFRVMSVGVEGISGCCLEFWIIVSQWKEEIGK